MSSHHKKFVKKRQARLVTGIKKWWVNPHAKHERYLITTVIMKSKRLKGKRGVMMRQIQRSKLSPIARYSILQTVDMQLESELEPISGTVYMLDHYRISSVA